MAKSKGKYADVLKDKPIYLGNDESHQDKVNAAKLVLAEFPNLHLSGLARMYVETRIEKEHAQKELSEIQVRIDALEQMLAQRMRDEEITSIKLESGQTVSTSVEPHPQIVNKEAFRQWCMANGYARSMQLWPATVASLVKQRLIAGEPEPPGVEVYTWNKFRVLNLGS